MDDGRQQTLEKALNYDNDILIRFYLQLKPSWNHYREQYVQLYFEARRCFFNNCPKAATIIAGESLLRAIFDRIVYLYEEPSGVDAGAIFLDPTAKRKTSLDTLFNDKDYSHYELVNKLTFHTAIEVREQSNLHDQFLYKKNA